MEADKTHPFRYGVSLNLTRIVEKCPFLKS